MWNLPAGGARSSLRTAPHAGPPLNQPTPRLSMSGIPTDPRRLRQVVTVELAWKLHQARIRVVDALVDEVREHVMLSLPSGLAPPDVGPWTRRLVADYLGRVLEHSYRGPQPEERGLPRVDETWRQAIEVACDPLTLAVLRLRYGDGLPAAQVARHCRLDPSSLQAIIEGLRELMRSEARARTDDGVQQGVAWIDALLEKVAGAAGASCPDASVLVGVLHGSQPTSRMEQRQHDHVDGCPHCARGVRLLRAGILLPDQLLEPPESDKPPATVDLLAIHVHPHARQHVKALAGAFGRAVLLVGEDSLLVDTSRAKDWKALLAERARMGLPSRDQVRGAVFGGPGRWTARVAIGPAPVHALELSRARPWGEVDGIPALPEPLPPPPSVARWWTGAVGVGAVAVLVGGWVLLEREQHATFPISAELRAGGGAIVARFDVDDRAYVNAYTIGTGGVATELESRSAADKASMATGDGDFELVTLESGLVIVSAPAPLDDLEQLFGSRDLLSRGPQGIRERIQALHPDSDVAVFLAGD